MAGKFTEKVLYQRSFGYQFSIFSKVAVLYRIREEF